MLSFSKIIRESKEGSCMKIAPEANYFKIVSRKTSTLARALIILGYCNPYFYKKIYGFNPSFRVFYDHDRGIYLDRSGMEIEKNNALKRIGTSFKYLDEVSKSCRKDGKKLLNFCDSLRKKNLCLLSIKELKCLVKTFMEKNMRLSAYMLFPLSIQKYLEQILKAELRKSLNNPSREEKYYEKLCTPIEENGHFFEQKSILSLAISLKKKKKVDAILENKIKQHLIKNGSQAMKYGLGSPWTKEDLIKRMIILAKDNPRKKLKELVNFHRESQEKAEKIIQKLKSPRFKRLVKIMREYIWLRTYRTETISNSFTIAVPLFQEIGRRYGFSYQEVLSFLPHELECFNFPNRKKLAKRNKIILMHYRDGFLYYNENKKGEEMLDNLIKKIAGGEETRRIKNKNQKISGEIAFRGVVEGKVKIVFDNSEIKKVNQGDILVSPMTTPDFVPAMEKAAAFITDEGGVLCHAAIISREMRKPCIIGTKNATLILKDGDWVRVEANKGIIEIMKKGKN